MRRQSFVSVPSRRSPCAVACSLDLLGDKWSLLVVRDLLRGKSTFKELAESPEGIPTNLLADRLRRLQNAEIVVASKYEERPPRYSYVLSDKGRELGAILSAFVQWGKKHIPGTRAMGRGTRD